MTDPNTLKKHTAAGQAYGYLFQIERALLWLAKSPKGSIVGIETEDDIVVKLLSGKKIHEQDKSSTSTFYPFNPKRKDLWNTLYIWLNAIKHKEIELSNTSFYLVTNKDGNGSLAQQLGLAKDKTEIKKCVAILRKIGKKPSNSIKKIVNQVLSFSDNELSELIERITFDDSNINYLDISKTLSSELQLDDDEYSLKIIDELIGWVFKEVTNAWKQKLPAFIERDSFMRKKNNSIKDQKFSTFNDIVKEVTKERQEQEMDEVFVKQLLAIECNEREVLNAIKCYIQTIDKITELATSGYITEKHYEKMKEYCTERWESIFQRVKVQYGDTKRAEEIGKLIFLETCEHIAKLNDVSTSYALTKGTYHKLSNTLTVGWHPNFETMFKK